MLTGRVTLHSLTDSNTRANSKGVQIHLISIFSVSSKISWDGGTSMRSLQIHKDIKHYSKAK